MWMWIMKENKKWWSALTLLRLPLCGRSPQWKTIHFFLRLFFFRSFDCSFSVPGDVRFICTSFSYVTRHSVVFIDRMHVVRSITSVNTNNATSSDSTLIVHLGKCIDINHSHSIIFIISLYYILELGGIVPRPFNVWHIFFHPSIEIIQFDFHYIQTKKMRNKPNRHEKTVCDVVMLSMLMEENCKHAVNASVPVHNVRAHSHTQTHTRLVSASASSALCSNKNIWSVADCTRASYVIHGLLSTNELLLLFFAIQTNM